MENNIWRCGKGSLGKIERKSLVRREDPEVIKRKYLPEYLLEKINKLEQYHFHGFGNNLTKIYNPSELLLEGVSNDNTDKLYQVLFSGLNFIKTNRGLIPFEKLDQTDPDLSPLLHTNSLIKEMESCIKNKTSPLSKKELELINSISFEMITHMDNYSNSLEGYKKELRKIPGYEDKEFKTDRTSQLRWKK
jgi:hypothetical protein